MTDQKLQYVKGTECPRARLCFPRFAKPEDGPKGKSGMLLAWPKSTDLSRIRAAMKAAIEEKFPSEATRPKFKNPIKDADTHVDDNGEPFVEKWPMLAGHYVVNVNTSKPFALVGPNPRVTIQPEDVLSGDWGRCSLAAKWYEFKDEESGMTKKGLKFYMGNVQKLEDREFAVGGDGAGSSAEDDFNDDVSKSSAAKQSDAAFTDDEWA